MQRTKKPEEKKIKTRQKIKKVKSKRCCRCQSTWLIIALLSHRYRYAVALLSLCCRSAVAPLLFRCCSAVATPLLLRCRAAVALLSHWYRSTVAPLMSLLCFCSCCCYTVAPLSHRYRATVAPLL